MSATLIEKIQIRDPFLLSGLLSSGVAVSFSGNVTMISGDLSILKEFANTGFFNSLTVSGDLNSPYLSGVLGTSIVGTGITHWSSVIDSSGNNLHYYVQYSTGNLTNIIFSASTQDSNNGWQFLDNGTWSPYPVLGLTAAQQQSAIVKHEYVASGLNIHTQYFASVKPIYAGNITGQFFDSAKFYPDSQGYEVGLVPSFKQMFDSFDSRYVIKRLTSTTSLVSGSYVSGIPIFFESADGGFPTTDLASGRVTWNNNSSGLFVYRTGVSFSGWHLINNIYGITGISGVRVNQPTGNVVLFLDFGTGSGQPPSGNDLRFFSSYHQSGGPDPLNIGGLSGVAATGQRVNAYLDTTYKSSYDKLSFSGASVAVSGDSANQRNLIQVTAISAVRGNGDLSPVMNNSLILFLGTGNMFVSGVPGTGIYNNTLYIYDTGTQSISVASGITVTGNAIMSGAGNITVSVGAMTASGQIVIISGSSTGGGGGGGVGNVTGLGLNAGPLFSGAFGFSGSGNAVVTMANFGGGVSGFIISSATSNTNDTFIEMWNTIGY